MRRGAADRGEHAKLPELFAQDLSQTVRREQ